MDVIKKVPLDTLINILVDLYEKGINFIDIQGNEEDAVTKMTITILPDYVDEEIEDFDEEFELDYEEWDDVELPIQTKEDQGLTEEDLNNLL